MRQEKRKEKNKFAISLFLCFSVIALASVFTVQNSIDKLNDINKSPSVYNSAGDQAVSKQVPAVDSRDNTPAPPAPESEFSKPVNGVIVNHYSCDLPIYSKTLDQYMVHCGVDIGAPLDAQVKAVSSGTVTKVAYDEMYGNTIEITHDEGLKSIYSNLSSAKMVEVGDVVEKGQVISGVGDSASFESLEASHLHFEMMKDNDYVNPEDYIFF